MTTPKSEAVEKSWRFLWPLFVGYSAPPPQAFDGQSATTRSDGTCL